MNTIDFFKQQAKNFQKDLGTETFNEREGIYEYAPRFFYDIEDILMCFDDIECDPKKFSLMRSQHIIARLAGFNKWNDLIKASEPALELGKLLLIHRQDYQQRIGVYTNMVESLIVDDWKSYEQNYLQGFDDETKLQVFKEVFLQESEDNRKRTPIIKLDFQNQANAQDMLCKLMREKNINAEKAILSSINKNNCINILSTGWANIALGLWGHDNPYAEKEKLENAVVEIKLAKRKRGWFQ